MYLLLSKVSGNLDGRPLLLLEKPDSLVLHGVIDAMVAWFPAFAVHDVTLGRFPVITPIMTTIALYFARNGGWTDIYCLGDVFFLRSVLE